MCDARFCLCRKVVYFTPSGTAGPVAHSLHIICSPLAAVSASESDGLNNML